MRDASTEVRRWLLIVCHFVGPLLFFTNLTRNPYVTQIALVHAGLALSLAAWAWSESGRAEGWRWPRLPVAWPMALFGALWASSWARAYFAHVPFFRPAIAAEGARNAMFLLAVCVPAFLLSATLAARDDGGSEVPLGAWAGFALGWGLLWSVYPQARARAGGAPEAFWPFVWDPYGAFVWAAGLAGVGALTRRGRVADFIHLTLCVGFLASAYGILQYFNVDFVWPYTLNPYGGRAVSTFGNPNFLSSYDVALMPIALALFLAERRPARRLVYAALFLTLEGALLATLTRSSWGGALVACAALLLFAPMRARLRSDPRPIGLLFGAAVAVAALWPSSSMATGYTPTVVGRLTEIGELLRRDGSYSPWHQRVLIWSCAWLMGSEAPVLGKGGGLFELFYPFYQGHMLHAFTFFHSMRTHANNAHNEILEVFSQVGLLGLGAFLAFWAAFFTAVRRWARGPAGADPLWVGAAAGCAGMLADSLLNVALHFAVPALLFWWLVGATMGRGAREEAGRGEWTAPRALRRAAAAALVLAAGIVVWYEARVWQREAWYFAGYKRERVGDLPGAEKALERSRAWGPREVNALYELGNLYARGARPQEAIRVYGEALDANAGYDEIYFNLGTVYNTALSQPDRARDFYEVAWAINPLVSQLDNGLSALYLREPAKYAARAVEVLREATRDFPDNADHWNNLGYALTCEKRWEEAEVAFTRALEIAPDLTVAERNLAAMAASSRRPPAPILAALRDLRALDAAVARRDNSDRVLALAASLARRAPRLVKARYLYGSLLLGRGRAAAAVPELEFVVARVPGKAAGHVNLGGAYRLLGRAAEASAQFSAALAAEPNNPQVRKALGMP